MSTLKNRVLKLEQNKHLDFDTDRPLSEWSNAELDAALKSMDPSYEPLKASDLRKFSLEELEVMQNEGRYLKPLKRIQ